MLGSKYYRGTCRYMIINWPMIIDGFAVTTQYADEGHQFWSTESC